MPTVAIVEGVRIRFYPQEHPPPHFHAVFAEHRARIGILPLRVLNRTLPPAKLAFRAILGRVADAGAVEYVVYGSGEKEAGESPMSEMLRITGAEVVLPGVLKLAWNDGYEGIVDLRGTIADGEIFEPIRDPENFKNVRVGNYGHYIYWGDEDDGVDFGCERLREIAEEQAALLARELRVTPNASTEYPA